MRTSKICNTFIFKKIYFGLSSKILGWSKATSTAIFLLSKIFYVPNFVGLGNKSYPTILILDKNRENVWVALSKCLKHINGYLNT